MLFELCEAVNLKGVCYSPRSSPLCLPTGFEPFGEHAVNASWVAVQVL